MEQLKNINKPFKITLRHWDEEISFQKDRSDIDAFEMSEGVLGILKKIFPITLVRKMVSHMAEILDEEIEFTIEDKKEDNE